MAKKGEAREFTTLKCSECGNENYRTSKNKRNTPERLLKSIVRTVIRQLIIKRKNKNKESPYFLYERRKRCLT